MKGAKRRPSKPLTTEDIGLALVKLSSQAKPAHQTWEVVATAVSVNFGCYGQEPAVILESLPVGPEGDWKRQAGSICVRVSRELMRRMSWVVGNGRAPLYGRWLVVLDGGWPATATLEQEMEAP